MFIKDEIAEREKDFTDVCRTHNVKYIYAFGSAISNRFDQSKSDIDLLVEIEDADPIDRGEKLMSLWDTFEVFFKRKVDLLTERSIHNPFLRQSIDSSKILIYDGSK